MFRKGQGYVHENGYKIYLSLLKRCYDVINTDYIYMENENKKYFGHQERYNCSK